MVYITSAMAQLFETRFPFGLGFCSSERTSSVSGVLPGRRAKEKERTKPTYCGAISHTERFIANQRFQEEQEKVKQGASICIAHFA